MTDVLKLVPAVVDAVADNWKLSALIVACMFILIYLVFVDNAPVVQVGVFLVFAAASLAVLMIVAAPEQSTATTNTKVDLTRGAFICGTVNVSRTQDKWLAVRRSQNPDSAMKEKLFEGQLVYAYDQAGNWLKIKADKAGTMVDGWIYAAYVTQHPCSD
ncbi:hypothetical protein [Sagittula stellata]|uniref:SH3b domain-containing protein n=1 Tax=Sagittula stellata (strain ATCC 700073 / DSM 11524 / E-37) TaxID=388399 RepID=A3K5R7_SAGS3|nr:hypothetical protein [Sagittula stellata]EBA07456.1 hypothetical protein SSE37_21695 [Sagittula stellata E-37]